MAGSTLCRGQDDTIGFWKITSQGKEISAVTINSEPTYFLEHLTDSSKINIYYYTESPCDKCRCKVQVRDTNGTELKTIERKGYGNNVPFCLSGGDISKWMPGTTGKVYLYFAGKYDGWMPWVFLGALKPLKDPGH